MEEKGETISADELMLKHEARIKEREDRSRNDQTTFKLR